MSSLNAKVAMARKKRFALRATYAKTNAMTPATTMPSATARIQSTPSRVAHADVYPPTIANAACENAN